MVEIEHNKCYAIKSTDIRQGLEIESTNSWSNHGIPGDTLQVLGVCSETVVPLHMLVNRLRVSCFSDELKQWLQQNLEQAQHTVVAEDIEDAEHASPHSSKGILCSVKPAKAISNIGVIQPITEVMLYACQIPNVGYDDEAAREGWDGVVRLPAIEEEVEHDLVAVYAVTISSELLYKPITTDASPKGNKGDIKALHAPVPSAQKHDRLSQLFDEETERRKKPRLKDGRERSTSRASSIMTSPMLPQDGFPIDNILNGKGSASDPVMIGTQTTTRVPASRNNSASMANEARPASRRGNLERTSTLLSQSFTADTALEQQIETRNKELISRSVLVVMKSYGLSSYKAGTKKTQNNVMGVESQGANSPDVAADLGLDSQAIEIDSRDAEYKSVYHQTMKATSFAFRKGMGSMMLRPESIKDVVDRLLAVFCTEPP